MNKNHSSSEQHEINSCPALGVVIVTFNSGQDILGCLESLCASTGVRLSVVVVDNGSTDGTPENVRSWLDSESRFVPSDPLPFPLSERTVPMRFSKKQDASPACRGHKLSLLDTGKNLGFAAGVNRGLTFLAEATEIDRFWVLNPDALVPPQTAAAFATEPEPEGGFALMGGRVVYLTDTSDLIQIDGGVINRRTGVTRNINQYAPHPDTPPPDPSDIDFVMGANMVASRAFLEKAGPIPEEYFLYYEETAWALKRDDLPLLYCKDGLIYHRAGGSIGTGRPGQAATPFAVYFMHRNRHRFVRRHFPGSWPGAYAYSLAKAGQLVLKGQFAGAGALLRGAFGLGPPKAVRERLSPEAQTLAFAPERR